MTIFNPAPAEAAILDSVAGYTQLGFRVAPSSDFDYAGVVIGVFSASSTLISWEKVSSTFANNNYILMDQLTSNTEYLVKVASIDGFIYNDNELIEASLNEENDLLNLESITISTLEVPALINLSNTLYNDAFTGTNVEAILSNNNFNYATISSNIDGVLENEFPASTSLKFSASINAHSITLELFKLLVEGIVETVTLSGSVNVSKIADGYLDDLEDRVNNNIDEVGSRTRTLETESRISRRNLQEANIAVLDSVAEAALKRDALNRIIRDNGRLVNAVVEVDPETGTITNKAYSYTDERFAEASLVIDGVEGTITSITEELTVTNDTLSDLSTTVTQLPGEFEVIATQVVVNEIASITPAHIFNFYDSAQGWVAVTGTLSATTPEQIDLTWGDIERSWTDLDDQYVAEVNPRIRIELERILPAGYPDTHTEVLDWTGDVYVDLYNPGTQTTTTEHFVGKIAQPAVEGLQIISVDFAGEDRYVGNVTRLRLVLGASTDDKFAIRNITIGKADAQTQLLDSIGDRVSTAEVKISALESEIEFTTTLDEVKNNINTTEAGDSIIESSTMGLLLDANEKFSQMFGQYQTINNNNVIENAGRAGLFIDVDPDSPDFVNFSTYAQNIQEQFDGYYTTTQVDTQIDGVKGTITDQSLQILTQKREGQGALQAQTDALIEYALFKAGVTEQNVTFAKAISQLNTDVGPNGALAEQITELEAVFTQEQSIRQAQVNSLSEAIADVDGARATDRTELEAEVEGARAFAIDQISGQVGYCSIDGEPTGYGSASECAASGGTWVEESLFTNSVRSIGFTTGNNETVTVSDVADAFQSVNGTLIARRSFILDNNGNISGLFLDNNGSTANTNFITDTFNVGRLVNDVYTPDLSLENGVLTLRGRLVVGTGEDEYVLDSEDSIRALDGQSTFKSIVFIRSNTTPSTPAGGDYFNPVPLGWSDGVPSGEEKLWQSTRIFTNDGEPPQQAGWTAPRDLTNTVDFEVQYSDIQDTTLAGTPTSNPTNWSNTPSTTTFLQAQHKKENGVWGSWDVFRVKGEQGEQGDPGPQGVSGEPGEDGQVYYTWIRYADTITGGGISNDPTDKEYIGFAYNKTTPTESNDPADYIWSRFRGEDGTDGVPGPPGEDGQTTYTWIAYSDKPDGSGMYQVPNENTAYIGIAVNNLTPTESTNPADYTWSRFRGEDGQDGAQGPAGADGEDGQNGAGFYKVQSSTNPSSLSNSQITSLFLSFMGRSPINRDIILVQGPSDLEGYIYSGTSWTPVGVLVKGDMIVSGSIAADRLAIRGGGNSLIPNTSFRSGSLEGWNAAVGSVLSRDPSSDSSAVRDAPAPYLYEFPYSASDQTITCLNWGEPVRAGETYMVSLEGATGGSSLRSSTLSITIAFLLSDGTPASYSYRSEELTSLSWNRFPFGPFVVPEGGASIQYVVVRREGGGSGSVYFTNFRVYKQASSVEIEDGAIRANKLNLRNVRNDTNTVEMTLDPGSDSPVEIRDITNDRPLFSIGYDGTTPRALVNGTAGAGFISNSRSITTEVKRSINPYYLSSGDEAQGSDPVLTSGDTDHFTINTGESGLVNINIDLSASASYADSLVSQNWTAPEWRIVIRRGTTTIFDHTYTGTGYNYQEESERDPFEPGIFQSWYGHYSINIETGVSDEAPIDQNVTYTVEATRVSGTATSLAVNDYSGKVAAFVRNRLEAVQTSTAFGVGSWTDKETGFTYQWGYSYVSGLSTRSVSFPRGFTACFQVIAARDMYTSDGHYEGAGVSNGSITNTGFQIENETPTNKTVRWMAVGII